MALVSAAQIGLSLAALQTTARAGDNNDDQKVDLTVTADRVGALVEHRVNTIEGWQTTLGVPVYTTTQQWEPVCVAPCNVKADPNSIFRVGGIGIAPSRDFTLPRDRNRVALYVSAGSGFAYNFGFAMTTTGSLFLAIGLIPTVFSSSITNTTVEDTVRGFGVAFLGTGALMLAVGLPLWLWGKSTVFSTPDNLRLAVTRGTLVF